MKTISFFCTKIYILQIVLINLLIVFPSLRFLLKFSNIYICVFYILGVNFGFILLVKGKIDKILYYFDWKVVVILFSVLSFFIRPIVDGRRDIGLGSTGDDAMIAAAKTLIGDAKLYSAHLQGNIPISPGPAWIIMNSPFTLLNIYFLFTPFYIFILCLFLNINFGRVFTNKFLFILIIMPLFWELVFNGHDIFPLSATLYILSIVVYKKLKNENNLIYTLFVAMFLGAVSTSRIILIFYPILISFFLFKFNKRNSIILVVISLFICLCFHGYYFLINEYYQPLHLFERGEKNVGIGMIIIGFSFFLGVIMYLYKNAKESIENWNWNILISFIIIFFTISIGEFRKGSYLIGSWEGANYIMPIIPFFIFYLISDSLNYYSIKSK